VEWIFLPSVSLEARIGPEGAFASFPNNPAGIAALAAFCQAHQVELVAMEATGGYEQRALALISEQGLPVAILNPRAVRRFADSMGQMEKTDRLDAGMIAWYAQTRRSQPVCLSSASQQQLRALVTRLRQLTEVRTAQLNQSRLVTDPAVVALIDELLAVVARQIRELETSIAQLVAQDPLWHQLDQVFGSIKGVADRTVARLMADMPEIGTLSNKTISKLAGVAPLARDSGKHQGKALGAGRPRLGARNPVHRCQCSGPLRTRLHRLPATSQCRRQAAQSHPHRPGPQAAGTPQCESSTSPPAACNRAVHNLGGSGSEKHILPVVAGVVGKRETRSLRFPRRSAPSFP
jgi:transposase